MPSIVTFVISVLATGALILTGSGVDWICMSFALPFIGVLLGIMQYLDPDTRSKVAGLGILLNACLCGLAVFFFLFASAAVA